MSLTGLPFAYKFKVVNSTGGTISLVSATFRRSFYNASGAITYETAAQSISAVSSMADGSAVSVGGLFSNETGSYLGIDGIFTATGSTATSGNLVIYQSISPDSSVFSDDDDGLLKNHFPLAILYFSDVVVAKSTPFVL